MKEEEEEWTTRKNRQSTQYEESLQIRFWNGLALFLV